MLELFLSATVGRGQRIYHSNVIYYETLASEQAVNAFINNAVKRFTAVLENLSNGNTIH